MMADDEAPRVEDDRSQSIAKLAFALAKAQGVMKPAVFDRENPGFHFRYATLASVWDAIRGPLSANELAVSQDAVTENGRVGVVTTLMHSSGEWKRSKLLLKPLRDDPQGVGSALTYARRYALSAIVGAVGDEDDDGNEASKPSAGPKQAQKPSQPTQRPATVRAAPSPTAPAESAPVASEVVSVKELTISEFWAGARELGYDTGSPKANAVILKLLEVADMASIKAMGYGLALDKLRLAAAAKAQAMAQEPIDEDKAFS